jgi:hypothetical protein
MRKSPLSFMRKTMRKPRRFVASSMISLSTRPYGLGGKTPCMAMMKYNPR